MTAAQNSPEQKPSTSAMNVATCRAVAAHESREEIRGPDTLAEIFLSEEAQKSLLDPAIHAVIRQKLAAVSPGGYEYFIARTAYLDGVVERALRDGIPQLVFLGAGYDTRAYRFAGLIGRARIFELDSAATQQHKRSVLKKAGIPDPPGLTYLTIDFSQDSLPEQLAGAGYAADQQTLFIWEGVTYSLPPAAVEATLASIRRCSPPGSVLCFDYMPPEADLAGRYGAAQSRAAMQAMYTAEPLGFALAEGEVAAFLAGRGFALIEHLTAGDLEKRYLTLRDGSLAGRALGLFGLVQAAVVA